MTGPGLSASFLYDPLGRRIKRTLNSAVTQFAHDGINVVEELSASGSVTATLLTGLGIDEVFRRTDASGGSQHFLRDVLGSTVALLDGLGLIQTEYTSTPFGETTATGMPSANAFQFTGRENDGTGLQYNRARYYHPVLQRFISEDPLGFGGGDVNLYSYTENGPTNATDPLGLDTVLSRGGFGYEPIGFAGSGEGFTAMAEDLRTAGQPTYIYGPDATRASADQLAISRAFSTTGTNAGCFSRGCPGYIEQIGSDPRVRVDRAVIIDSADMNGGVRPTIPENMGTVVNYYQPGRLGSGPVYRADGTERGITNVPVPDATHFTITENRVVTRGMFNCFANGACGGSAVGAGN